MRSPFDEPGKELLISQNVFEKHHFQNICWFPSTRKREVGVRDGLVDSGRSARPPPGTVGLIAVLSNFSGEIWTGPKKTKELNRSGILLAPELSLSIILEYDQRRFFHIMLNSQDATRVMPHLFCPPQQGQI